MKIGLFINEVYSPDNCENEDDARVTSLAVKMVMKINPLMLLNTGIS